MIGKARYYIFYNYFKYIFIILFIFIGLIWLSQIIRIIEFQYSFSYQIFDVAISTLFALPSFTNPLVPFLILIGSFLVNTKLSNDNEIIILKQYLSENRLNALFYFLTFIIFIFFTINSEIISKKFYEKYKIKELEIRNNLKLGTPSQKEFHIGEIASIFFEEEKNQVFYNVNAIINYENQFITAESVEIEISKNNFNLVFNVGERLILNSNENSKTVFNKYTYVLENKNYEKLLMDKDHYNTYELIRHPEKEFKNHGHNKIFQYFFLAFITLISLKIIFFYVNKKQNNIKFSLIFLLVFLIQVLNSYLIYLLNNHNEFNLIHYYSIIFIILISAYYVSIKVLK